MTKEIKNQIINDYKSGIPVLELAAKYNYSKNGIYYILSISKIPLQSHLNKIKIEQMSKFIIEDYLAGYTYRSIQKKYDLNSSKLTKILNAHNIQKRGNTPKNKKSHLVFKKKND